MNKLDKSVSERDDFEDDISVYTVYCIGYSRPLPIGWMVIGWQNVANGRYFIVGAIFVV